MSKPPKIDRKSLKTPDSFVLRGRALLGFILEKRMTFIPILVAVILFAIGAYLWDGLSTRKMEKTWTEFYDANKVAEPAKWDALKKVAEKASSNRAGFFAAVTLADHFEDVARKEFFKPEFAGKGVPSAAMALDWYGKALGFSEILPTERQLLLINHGEALELQRKYDEAMTDYQKAAALTGEGKAFAFLQVGRIWDLKNDLKKAMEVYDKLAADFSTTEYAKMAKTQSRRLKSALWAGYKL